MLGSASCWEHHILKKKHFIGVFLKKKHFLKEADGDGGSAVQLYAKECSKLLLHVLKREPSQKDDEVVTSIGDEKEAEYFCVMAREEEKKKLLQMYAKTSIIMMRKKMKIF